MALWTPEETKTCLAIWERGGSFGVIADFLRTKTRNAVAGHLNRAGKHRPIPVERKLPPPRKTQKQIIEEAMQKTFTFDPGRSPSSLIDRCSDGCQFPLGDSPFRFCNQQQVPGTPYCVPHCRMVYQPPRAR